PHGARGQRHGVRRDAGLLIREPVAGAAAAGLDLVKDEQQALLVAQLPQPLQKAGGRNLNTAFALNRLDEDGAGLVGGQLAGRFQVAIGGILKTGDERAEPLVIFGLGRRGERAERAAVEAAREGDDLVAAFAVQSSKLDRRLVRLRAAVAEKRL